MKNMVVKEVCCMPISTTLAITLSTSKMFFYRHLFNEDGEGPVEVLKGEKLDQTLLKFAPLCFDGICYLIASLKHHLGDLGSIDYIHKLKVLSGYDFI